MTEPKPVYLTARNDERQKTLLAAYRLVYRARILLDGDRYECACVDVALSGLREEMDAYTRLLASHYEHQARRPA